MVSYKSLLGTGILTATVLLGGCGPAEEKKENTLSQKCAQALPREMPEGVDNKKLGEIIASYDLPEYASRDAKCTALRLHFEGVPPQVVHLFQLETGFTAVTYTAEVLDQVKERTGKPLRQIADEFQKYSNVRGMSFATDTARLMERGIPPEFTLDLPREYGHYSDISWLYSSGIKPEIFYEIETRPDAETFVEILNKGYNKKKEQEYKRAGVPIVSAGDYFHAGITPQEAGMWESLNQIPGIAITPTAVKSFKNAEVSFDEVAKIARDSAEQKRKDEIRNMILGQIQSHEE